MKVQLRYAGLPFIGAFAVHYWFVVFEGARAERWEVWQRKNAGGTSIGHVHCNLKHPDDGVGGGPYRIATEWQGEAALRIHAVLREIETRYPDCHRYVLWPGPNSNSFVAWVLEQAGIDFRLGLRGIGRGYYRRNT